MLDDEAAGRLYARIGEALGYAIAEHEERLHVAPAACCRQVVPFAELDLILRRRVARAIVMAEDGATLDEVADAIGSSVPMLERESAYMRSRMRRYVCRVLSKRETAV